MGSKTNSGLAWGVLWGLEFPQGTYLLFADIDLTESAKLEVDLDLGALAIDPFQDELISDCFKSES